MYPPQLPTQMPDVQSLLQGRAAGQQMAMQGSIPTGNNATGSPPSPMDPYAAKCDRLTSDALELANDLRQSGDLRNAEVLLNISKMLTGVCLDRKDKIAKGMTA